MMSNRHVFHHTCQAMGTRFTMVLPGFDPATGAELAERVEGELRRLQALMSRFDADSPLSKINRLAATEAVTPPDALWEILTACRGHWQRTKGCFDVAQLALTEFWRHCAAEGETPSPEALAEVRRRAGFQHVILEESSRSVRFDVPGVGLDLGGFGKGFALDRLTALLKHRGINCAFLSFGESSVTVLGRHPAGPAWAVGVADMFKGGEPLHTFHLEDASLSTSGNAPWNGADDAGRFGHIIDSREGVPTAGFRTLSVVSASAAEAEVLSTALLVAAVEERPSILSRYPGTTAIEILHTSAPEEGPTGLVWRSETRQIA